MNLKEREIFDEKIKISIPSGMIDASKFREIPDNQYVWIVQDEAEFESIQNPIENLKDFSLILELVELQTDWNVESHINELVSENQDLPSPPAVLFKTISPSISLIAKMLHLKKFNSTKLDSVFVVMGLIRLADVETDVVITMNIPMHTEVPTCTERAIHDVATKWTEFMQAILSSFQILDWSLFR